MIGAITSDQLMLTAYSLFKSYYSQTVVHDVSIQVQQGEIVGLLGPMALLKRLYSILLPA